MGEKTRQSVGSTRVLIYPGVYEMNLNMTYATQIFTPLSNVQTSKHIPYSMLTLKLHMKMCSVK